MYWIHTIAFLLSIGMVRGCDPLPSWVPLTMEQRLDMASIVVLGTHSRVVNTAINVTGRKDPWYRTDSLFEVSCVFKGDGKAIEEFILVEGIEAVDSCDLTSIGLREPVIVGLKRTGSGNFKFDDERLIQTIAFPYTDTNFDKTLDLFGLGSNGTLMCLDIDSNRCRSEDSQLQPCTAPSFGVVGLLNTLSVLNLSLVCTVINIYG